MGPELKKNVMEGTGVHGDTVGWGTGLQVSCSIPSYVIQIFYWLHPTGSTKVVVKAAIARGWQPCHLHVSNI